MRLLILCAATALTAGPALAQPQSDSSTPAEITVTGQATIKTAPDMAVIDLSIHGEGKTSDEASKALADKQEKIKQGLRSLDPQLSFNTKDVTVKAQRVGKCSTSFDYDVVDRSDAAGPCRILGYVASIDAKVRMSAVDKAGTAIGLASRLGATKADLSEFSLRDPEAAQQQAIKLAMVDARKQATALAGAYGGTLGKVKSIAYPPNSYDKAPPLLYQAMPAPQVIMPAPIKIEVSPEKIETSAKILVVFDLQP